jgi:hypothetical protein
VLSQQLAPLLIDLVLLLLAAQVRSSRVASLVQLALAIAPAPLFLILLLPALPLSHLDKVSGAEASGPLKGTSVPDLRYQCWLVSNKATQVELVQDRPVPLCQVLTSSPSEDIVVYCLKLVLRERI